MEVYGWTDPKLGRLVIATSDPIGREMIRLARKVAETEELVDNLRAEIEKAARDYCDAEEAATSRADALFHRKMEAVKRAEDAEARALQYCAELAEKTETINELEKFLAEKDRQLALANGRIQALSLAANEANRHANLLQTMKDNVHRCADRSDARIDKLIRERDALIAAVEDGIAHVDMARTVVLDSALGRREDLRVLGKQAMEELDLAHEVLSRASVPLQPPLWSAVEPATEDEPEHVYAIFADGTYTVDGVQWPMADEHPAIAELARRLLAERQQ